MGNGILQILLALISERPSRATLTGFALALALVRYYQSWHYNRTYWSRRGVPGEQPWPIFSSLYDLFITDRASAVLERTRKYGKVYGTFMLGAPQLYIADPEVLRQVAVKDFDLFQNHQGSGGNARTVESKYRTNALLWLQGAHWKRVRALMTPSFTSGKIKRMYKLLDECANDLVESFAEQCPGEVNLTATYSLYTMDGITTCGYGLKLKRQTGDIDIGRASTRNQLIKDIQGVLGLKLARIGLMLVLPRRLLAALNFQLVPESIFKPLAERMEVLIERRRAMATAGKYDDLLQSLVDAKLGDQLELSALDGEENHHAGLSEQSLRDDQQSLVEGSQQQVGESSSSSWSSSSSLGAKLTNDEIIASAIFLMAAGLDTTRASLATISYLLAHNPHVQERLHEELGKIARSAGSDGHSFDYDELIACKYLDAVISESLRFFGPAALTDRCALEDYYIEKYDVRVPKGTNLLLGLHSVANDPDYWVEPHVFNPERFMPGQREQIVPGSYAPFSLGPRHCLGMRFSLTETKLGLAKVLMRFKFEPAPNARYPPVPTRGISLVSIKDCRVQVKLRSQVISE